VDFHYFFILDLIHDNTMNFIQKQLFKASSKLSSKNTIVSVELEDGKISDDENDLVGYFNEIEGLERKILAVKHADFSGLNDFFSGAYAISNYMSDSNFSILATKELDLPIIGSLLKYLGFVFVNRSGKKEEKKESLDQLIKDIDKNYVVIAPNGSRYPQTQKIGLSLAEKALLMQSYVIPIGIKHLPEEEKYSMLGRFDETFITFKKPDETYITFGQPIKPPNPKDYIWYDDYGAIADIKTLSNDEIIENYHLPDSDTNLPDSDANYEKNKEKMYEYVQDVLIKSCELNGEAIPKSISRTYEEAGKLIELKKTLK
jgi:hypothetical protein